MKLSDILVQEAVKAHMEAATSEEAVAELSGLLCQAIGYPNQDLMTNSLQEREDLGSTAVGEGVAIPHARVPNMSQVCVTVGLSDKGVDFHASDKKKSHLIFMLVGPVDAQGMYLKALARIAKLAKDDAFRAKIAKCDSPQDVVKAILDAEAKY